MSQENRKPKLFVPGRKKGPIDLPAETHLFFSHFQVGKVNHCSLHSRSAKFRGLMYQVKYGDVIGRETRIFVCAYNYSNNFQAMGFF